MKAEDIGQQSGTGMDCEACEGKDRSISALDRRVASLDEGRWSRESVEAGQAALQAGGRCVRGEVEVFGGERKVESRSQGSCDVDADGL